MKKRARAAFHGEFAVTPHSGQRLHCSRTYAELLKETVGA